jgi:hypothetical protein
VFEAVLDALVEDVLGPVVVEAYDLVGRQLRTGRHVYDVHPALNLLLRVLDPTSSTLEPSRDHLRGRSAEVVLLDAVQGAMDTLGVTDPEAVADLRRDYRMERVCSPTGGVVGPCYEMPFLERGTWIHMTGFVAASPRPPRPDAPRDPGGPGGPPAGPPSGPGGPSAGAGGPATTPVAAAARPAGALPATGGGSVAVGLLALSMATVVSRRRSGTSGAA